MSRESLHCLQATHLIIIAAYFTQATVNGLQKVEDVLLNVPLVPDGLFQSARSGKQRHGAKTQRPITFANSFATDAPGSSPVGPGIAGPSGLNQATQFGPGPNSGPQSHLEYIPGQNLPQYSPYRGQEAYDMQAIRQPLPGPPPHQHSTYSPPYAGVPYAHAAHLQHPPLPPPPSMPQYSAHPQAGPRAMSVDGPSGREREYEEARRREEEQQFYRQKQSPHAPARDSITVVTPSVYMTSPARPIAATLSSSPKPGHPYANALHMRPQRSGSVQGMASRPSEYFEPAAAPKPHPASTSPTYMTGPSGGGSGLRDESDGSSGVAGGGVYRIPHSHSHAHARHRSSPVQASSAPGNAVLPHHLPLPPSPPAPTSHLGATDVGPPVLPPLSIPVPVHTSDSSANAQMVVPVPVPIPAPGPASGAPSSGGGESASVSPSVSTAVSSAPTIAAPLPLPAFSSLPLAPNGTPQEKERVLVPLGNLKHTNLYRRRDPTDDALLRRFNALRTTPPAHVMEG